MADRSRAQVNHPPLNGAAMHHHPACAVALVRAARLHVVNAAASLETGISRL